MQRGLGVFGIQLVKTPRNDNDDVYRLPKSPSLIFNDTFHQSTSKRDD